MTYQDWAREYYDSAKRMKESIERLKHEMKNTPVQELAEISSRLSIMYDMYLDCIHVADMLGSRKGEC